MKKKILSGLFTLALLATAGFGVHKSMRSDAGLSFLGLMNVEALANGESPGDGVYETYKLIDEKFVSIIEGVFYICNEKGIQCLGEGTLKCVPESIINCKPA